MQFARASRDRLIFAPSMRRIPLFSVLEARSDPAKSIRLNLPCVTSIFVSFFDYSLSIMIYKTACDLLECALAFVGSTVLLRFAELILSIISSQDSTLISVKPATTIPCLGSSQRSIISSFGFIRSRTVSLYISR